MKKIVLFIACIVYCFSPCVLITSANAFTYAQIKDNAILFDAQKREICSLPSTYFVMVVGESDGEFLPVYYNGIEGFVKNDTVEAVDYEPKYKYLDAYVTFSNDGHKINLRDKPSHTEGAVIAEVESGTKALYLGEVEGDIQVSQVGALWYYCKVNKKGESIVGYVYSLYALVDEILPNVIEKVEQIPPQDTPTEEVISTPTNALREVVIILSLCLPVLVGIYLIFRR